MGKGIAQSLVVDNSHGGDKVFFEICQGRGIDKPGCVISYVIRIVFLALGSVHVNPPKRYFILGQDKTYSKGFKGLLTIDKKINGRYGKDGMFKVLVVEDDNDNREILRQQLKHLGYEVVEATNGFEGLKQTEKEKPDLVIVDIVMPGGMDGAEMAQRVRRDLKMKDLPILAVTVLFQREDVQSCLDAGCDAFLSKPITLKGLKEKLDQLLHLAGHQK